MTCMHFMTQILLKGSNTYCCSCCSGFLCLLVHLPSLLLLQNASSNVNILLCSQIHVLYSFSYQDSRCLPQTISLSVGKWYNFLFSPLLQPFLQSTTAHVCGMVQTCAFFPAERTWSNNSHLIGDEQKAMIS